MKRLTDLADALDEALAPFTIAHVDNATDAALAFMLASVAEMRKDYAERLQDEAEEAADARRQQFRERTFE